ncbi:DUF1906 domain-containing protein [Corallococcus terminator]
MSTLSGVIQSAPPGLLGVDADSPLSSADAQQLFALGYRFCGRYLSLSTPQKDGDLSTQEATSIIGAGLALVPVQHVLEPGWSPRRELGTAHGQAALRNAQQLGIPFGVNVWCDLEGIAKDTAGQDIIDYCHAWYDAVDAQGKGYVPGLYVGYDARLSMEQLREALPFQHYWGGVLATPVAEPGTQLLQLLPLNRRLWGVEVRVDVDVTLANASPHSMKWLALEAPPCK